MPILFPQDCFKALDTLCDKSYRTQAGVNPTNLYVFASTRGSEDHQSGWHALYNICSKLDLEQPENIKATSNRHRISTIFASLDMQPNDRSLFFKHMGHSQLINEHIYQNPMAIREVVTVGKSLMEIDSGRCSCKVCYLSSTLRKHKCRKISIE